MLMEDYGNALPDFEKVISLDPNDVKAYLRKIDILTETGELDRARDLIDEVAKRFPNSEEVKNLK